MLNWMARRKVLVVMALILALSAPLKAQVQQQNDWCVMGTRMEFFAAATGFAFALMGPWAAPIAIAYGGAAIFFKGMQMYNCK